MNILQMLCKFSLIIGLTACSSSASKEENKSTKMMLNEIYDSQIKPDYFLKIQENHEDVSNIVFKYFKVGESKEEVLLKLTKMNISPSENKNKTIVVSAIKGNDPLFHKDDDKTLEVMFEFDASNKLTNIKSRYFRRQ